MNPGCDLPSSQAASALARRVDWIYAAVGSHPDAADQIGDEVLQEYRNLAQGNSKVKAIGEIGLDYHYEDVPRQQQILCFREQMALARELDLPVIIHEREAHEDALQVLADFPQVTGVFHCYSGSAEMARRLVSQGWYIGFTGVITFKNARKLVETAMAISSDRMVIETDCPYMAPEPFQGRRNDPGYVYRMSGEAGRAAGNFAGGNAENYHGKRKTAVPLELGGSMLTKNQIYTALITDYTAQGQGVGPHRGLCRFCTQRHCRGSFATFRSPRLLKPGPLGEFTRSWRFPRTG